MNQIIDNSFYHQECSIINVMILVPHEDDELNTASALIHHFVVCGARVSLIYATNGDWKHPAATRMREAAEVAAFLHIRKEDLYFLGYGDSVSTPDKTHIFYHFDDVVQSVSGHAETYGDISFCDYSYRRNGNHHAYTAQNYLDDLISIIEDLRPQLIVCSDFDEHPDHKMLSLYFEKAIGIICRRDPTYAPCIWKRFAYALAYSTFADYTSMNNPATRRPMLGETDKYHWDIIDSFYYSWADRIRIPVPAEYRIGKLRKNLLVKALLKHKSQYIITKADRILNSDEVYWSRRTDNLAFCANVNVSSGNGEALHDFLLYWVDNIDTDVPDFSECCWRPEEHDEDKTAVFCWEVPVAIRYIVLYSMYSMDSTIEEIGITLSDGTKTVVSGLPSNGNPVFFDVGLHTNITFCELKIISGHGSHYGISECEFYSDVMQFDIVKPFCKIVIQDNFAYQYMIGSTENNVRIACYQYGNTGCIHYHIVQGKAHIDHEVLIFDDEEDTVVLKASNEDGSVFDQVMIHRVSGAEIRKYRNQDNRNRLYLKIKRIEFKFHNMFFILRTQGVVQVIKRTLKNVILPFFNL